MPSVKVRENEPFEFALRRFKRTCEKAGVLAETRKREFYEKPTQERKRKAAAAVKRQARRSSRDVTKRQRLYWARFGCSESRHARAWPAFLRTPSAKNPRFAAQILGPTKRLRSPARLRRAAPLPRGLTSQAIRGSKP